MIVFPNFLQVSASMIMFPLPVVNLDGQGLKMEWDIERTRSGTPDRGVITIYNLSVSARKAIHEVWKTTTAVFEYTVELSIGWGGLVERIFVGDAWKLIPEIRAGEDVLTVFEVGDGNTQVRDTVTPLGANLAKTTFQSILLILVSSPQGLGIPIDPVSLTLILAKAATLPIQIFDNYVGFGTTADNIDELIDMLGLEWKIYQGVFIVTQAGNAATASPIATVLRAGGGLLDWAQEDNGGVSCLALANPNVKPGSQISVIDSFGIPVGATVHRVEKVAFRGSTDGESVMEIVARKALLL